MRTYTSLPVLVLLAALLIATPVQAQNMDDDMPRRSQTDRLFLAIGRDGQSLTLDEDGFSNGDTGGGLTLRAGWGVSDQFTIYLGFGAAAMEGDIEGETFDYAWGGIDLGTRFNFRAGEAVVPYLDAGLRGVAAVYDEGGIDLELTGGGFTFGGGVSFFVSPAVAFDLGLRLGAGNINEITLGNISTDLDGDEFGYGEVRCSLGMVCYPLR